MQFSVLRRNKSESTWRRKRKHEVRHFEKSISHDGRVHREQNSADGMDAMCVYLWSTFSCHAIQSVLHEVVGSALGSKLLGMPRAKV